MKTGSVPVLTRRQAATFLAAHILMLTTTPSQERGKVEGSDFSGGNRSRSIREPLRPLPSLRVPNL
jgi:hypothetical protein